MRPVTIGILTPLAASSADLQDQLRKTGLATVTVKVNEYCRTRTDSNTRRFLDAPPEVILIDAEDFEATLISIQVLHTAIPSAWILVCTRSMDTDTILKMVRAGARELIPMPLASENLTQALQRHIEEREREQNKDVTATGKIYTVCSAKRGSGATTMAINLAASLAEDSSARVALIDLDWPLGDVAASLNIKPRFTIADALASVARLDPVLLESYMHQHERVHVLAGLEEFTAGDAFDASAVAQLLEVVTQTYTHVVIDLPLGVPHQLVQVVSNMSTAIAALITPDILSLRRAERLLRVFTALEVTDKVRIVLNRSHKSDEITDADVEKVLHQPVASRVGNDYHACIDAINSGKAVLTTSNRTLARNYRDLASQLLGQNQDKRRGLLRLFPRTSLSA